MKRILLLLLLLLSLLAIPASATITRAQHQPKSCTASPCSITVTSTTAGNLGVAIGSFSSQNAVISSVTAGACSGSWTSAGADSNDTLAGSASIWYCASLVGSITTIAISSSGTFFAGEFLEYHSSSAASWTLDTVNHINNQSASTSCLSAPLTTVGTLDVVVDVCQSDIGVNSGASVSGSGWTTPVVDTPGGAPGIGIDDAIGVASGFNTQGNITQGSGTYSSSTASFCTNGPCVAAAVSGVNKRSKLGKLGIL